MDGPDKDSSLGFRETKIAWTPISVPLMLACITEVPMYRKLVFQVCNLPGTDWHEESH